jgi:hypothetical protein
LKPVAISDRLQLPAVASGCRSTIKLRTNITF